MKETLSALIDGELDAAEAAPLLDRVKVGEPGLEAAWSDWHLIGEAMRRKPLLLVDVRSGVRAALQTDERRMPVPAASRLRPLAAVVLAVGATAAAVVGWTRLDEPNDLAAAPAAVAEPAGDAVGAPSLNPYVLAHQELVVETGLRQVALEAETRP